MGTTRLLIVVPTLNEAQNIEPALRLIARHAPEADILIVDDCSTDGTVEIAERLKAELPQIRVMVRTGKKPGLGVSIRDTWRYVLDHGYSHHCIVDCDLQSDPADVPRLMKHAEESDIVIGSRYLGAGSFVEGYHAPSRRMSAFACGVMRVLFHFPYRDVSNDFCVVKTAVLAMLPPEKMLSTGYALFSELKLRAWKAGFRFAEIETTTHVRTQGRSHRSWRQVKEFGGDILRVWADVNLRAHP
jgi:glycosyltransferase involved in cell wall biosynthesis